MRIRTPTILLLILSLSFFVGCDQSNQVELQISSSTKKTTELEKEKVADPKQDRDKSSSQATSPAKKTFVEKFGCQWSDAKESDFPLTIILDSPPVPKEIIGPFPENADWRSEKTTPEQKPSKGFWPWS
jgi:hypothetical protein